MKKEILKILGEYKVIGDTTYRLGYKESEELADKLLEKTIEIITTHTEHEGIYCDTGDDMDWGCRSDCVRLAVERLTK